MLKVLLNPQGIKGAASSSLSGPGAREGPLRQGIGKATQRLIPWRTRGEAAACFTLSPPRVVDSPLLCLAFLTSWLNKPGLI